MAPERCRASRAPKQRRKRVIPNEVEKIILSEREKTYRLGKKKVAVALREAGYRFSDSTVGRMIGNLKQQGKLPKNIRLSLYAKTGRLVERKAVKTKKIRRPKECAECIEVDTIIRFVDGIKRYILTAVDTKKKFAFAYAYTGHSSKSAADFLAKLKEVAPFEITAIQTDNGSEFMDHFKQACVNLKITQFHTYPRSPKMNACIERFNRTLNEEFLIWNRALMRDDLTAFNRKLIDYLLWYNTKRPHHSLGLLSPMSYICNQLSAEESHMWWTSTFGI